VSKETKSEKMISTRKTAMQHWLDVCRQNKRTPYIKRAAEDSNDSGGSSVPFEQAFSSLAHAYLQDRAPALLQYELGFQLMEKNTDNDRAIGVFGFKVGPQLLYAPVFFSHGKLEGHELLYLKESDTFVPMKEDWINYILNRKPNIIGAPVMSQLNRLGVDRPSMDPFRIPPSRTSKYGSATDNWLELGLPGLLAALGNPTRPPAQLPALVKSSAAVATRFLRLLDTYPTLAKPIVDCYGKDLVTDAILTAKTAASVTPIEVANPPRTRKIIRGSAFRQKSAEDRGLLKVWIYDGTPGCAEGLNEKQAAELATKGIYIQDSREADSTSKVYTDAQEITMQNPDETGIYKILTRPSTIEKCLYVKNPVGPRGSHTNALCVTLESDDGCRWTETSVSKVFALENLRQEWRAWFDGLPDANDLEEGSVYTLLAPNGEGTGVFRVHHGVKGTDGKHKVYKVEWCMHTLGRRPDRLNPGATRHYEMVDDSTADKVVLNYVKGKRFLVRLDSISAPPGTKKLKLRDFPEDKASTGVNETYRSSEPCAIQPGEYVDFTIGLYKHSSALKVFNDGIEAIIDGSRMSTRAGLLTLVRTYGLREKAASEVLELARRKHGARLYIKFADAYGTPPGVLGSPPTSPPFPPPETGTDSMMGSGLPTSFSQEQEIPVEQMRGLPTRPNYADPPDPQMAQQIQQAAQTGQKEVLDTSMLANLLRGSQNETLIDKHLPALMKGLDSLGRLLFNMYWHHDKFEDRYGDRDLADLKDSMRNAFDTLGDVTLELKQDAIEPSPGESGAVQGDDE
jgi:hypothetical protein